MSSLPPPWSWMVFLHRQHYTPRTRYDNRWTKLLLFSAVFSLKLSIHPRICFRSYKSPFDSICPIVLYPSMAPNLHDCAEQRRSKEHLSYCEPARRTQRSGSTASTTSSISSLNHNTIQQFNSEFHRSGGFGMPVLTTSRTHRQLYTVQESPLENLEDTQRGR